MLIKNVPQIRSSEITPRAVYMNRREWLSSAGSLTLALAAPFGAETAAAAGAQLTVAKRSSGISAYIMYVSAVSTPKSKLVMRPAISAAALPTSITAEISAT